jgi:hypothetical protein
VIDFKIYDIFIAHCWRYCYDYYQLLSILKSISGFYFRNNSDPVNDYNLDPDSEMTKGILLADLEMQIMNSTCVIIILSMCGKDNFWIEQELKLSQKYSKPIIFIKNCSDYKYQTDISYDNYEIIEMKPDLIVDSIKNGITNNMKKTETY